MTSSIQHSKLQRQKAPLVIKYENLDLVKRSNELCQLSTMDLFVVPREKWEIVFID